jgi:hypothetical protein
MYVWMDGWMDVLRPWVRGIKQVDVNLKIFCSCYHPAVTTGNFLRRREMDKIDYEKGNLITL